MALRQLGWLPTWCSALWRALTLPTAQPDPEVRRKVQLLALLQLAALGVNLLLFAVRTPMGLASTAELVNRVVLAGFLSITLLLTRRGYLQTTTYVIIVVASALLFALAYSETGSTRLQILNYLSIVVFFASTLIWLRGVLVVGSAYLVVMLLWGAAADDLTVQDMINGPVSFNLTVTLMTFVIAYYRTRLNWYHRDQERELRLLAEALANTAAVVNGTLDLDQVLDRILENLVHVVRHDASSIMLIDGEMACVVRSRGFDKLGLADEVAAYAVSVKTAGNLRQMIETRAPVWYEDVRALVGWGTGKAENLIRAYLGVPIIVDDTVIGFLNLDGLTPGMFNAAHALRVRAFADQAAVAIRNAQLYEAEQRRRRSAELLAQASATINATLDLSQVLNLILQQLQDVVSYDSASVIELDGDELEIVACQGFASPEDVVGARFRLEPHIAGLPIIKTRRPLTFGDVMVEFPQFHDENVTADAAQIRSWLGVPLLIKDRVLGLITVDRFRVQPFTEDDVALTLALANQAAVAIENARLYTQVHEYAEQLEQRVAQRTADLQQEIAERERTAAALLASEERYRIVTEMISDYIYSVIVYPDGTMETGMMSGAVEQITGYTVDEIRALGWNALVHPDDLERVSLQHWPHVSAGQTVTLEYRVIAKSGAVRWIRDYQRPVRDEESGRITLLWGAVQDITELRRQMELLEAANEELRRLSRIKDEFVSNVTHELRTPITNLKLRQDLMQVRPDRAAEHLDVMRRETNRLARTIDHLLLLSRMDQGRSMFEVESVDLNLIAQQYANDRAALAETRGLSLGLTTHPDTPCVQADPDMLGQALSILLTNALHYTPAGGRVMLHVLRDTTSPQPRAGIAVKDNGPGIPPEEQPRLFERFFRGTAAQQSGKPGTGLGLAILKGIVDRHGGQVEVCSTGIPGEGATFTIWLPVLRAVSGSAAAHCE